MTLLVVRVQRASAPRSSWLLLQPRLLPRSSVEDLNYCPGPHVYTFDPITGIPREDARASRKECLIFPFFFSFLFSVSFRFRICASRSLYVCFLLLWEVRSRWTVRIGE